jgi:hypothetical protein
MAKTVTSEQIIEINELYKEIGVYAEVARRVGLSASTVRKYVKSDYISAADLPILRADIGACRQVIENFTLSAEAMRDEKVLNLTEEEIEGIKKLWGELVL